MTNSTTFTRTVGEEFVVIFGLLIIIFGTIGNGFTLAVIWTYKTMRPASRVLFALLAVVDEGALLLAETRYWIIAYKRSDLRDMSKAACIAHTYFTYTFVNMSVWLLAIISTERFCFTFFPMKKHPFKQIRGSLIIILVATVINCVKNIFLIFQPYAPGKCKETGTNAYVLNIVDIIIGYTAPYIIMFLTTSLILWKVLQQRKQICDQNSMISMQSRSKATTIMLIGVVVTQLLIGTPGYVYSVVYTNKYHEHKNGDVIYISLLTITITNNALNFYIYFLTTRGFREVFYHLFCPTKTVVSLSLAPTIQKSHQSSHENP